MSKKTMVSIDVSDWLDLFYRVEPTLETEEDLIRLVEEGHSTGQVGCMATAARAKGIAPDNILKPPKMHLYAGARADVTARVTSRREEHELENGKVVSVRSFVGLSGRPKGVFEEEEGDDGEMALDVEEEEEAVPFYVASDTTEALGRAEGYLLKTVPGHIYERLKVVAVAGGDVTQAGEDLKAKVDELVARLV